MTDRWATFDCYGTLIDWDGGLRRALALLWPDANEDRLFHRYQEGERRVQAGRDIPYRRVLRETLEVIAEAEDLEVPAGHQDALAEALPSWSPFPEVPGSLAELRDRGWCLGILSNTDPDLLGESLAKIGVEVEVRITAAEAGSYKPAHGHWDTFFRMTAADRERHVHVAASLYHDVEPCAQLGLPCVWINRVNESSALPRAGELLDLAPLPTALDALVPR
ncbi:MAG: HAD family hydrolase [Actinomycetota bacterium]|nr:HAD family hydrolase [Actinomycetota bacterium]